MGTFTASLQPETRVRGDFSVLKADPVVSTYYQLPGGGGGGAIARDEPSVQAGDHLSRLVRGFWQEMRNVFHQVDMSVSLVTCSGNDQIHVKDLTSRCGCEIATVGQLSVIQSFNTLNVDPEASVFAFIARVGLHDLITAHDAMRPLCFVAAVLPPLLVQAFVQALNEVEAHDSVVGVPGLAKESLPVKVRSRKYGVGVGRVEHGIDARWD